MVTHLNGDFSKVIEDTNIASQKAHALEKMAECVPEFFQLQPLKKS